MTHPRALTEQEAIEAERWYQEYERVGTIRGKARELGVNPQTLYDAIRRIRGQDTRVLRQKLSSISAGGGKTFHVEQTIEVVSVGEPAHLFEEQTDKTR